MVANIAEFDRHILSNLNYNSLIAGSKKRPQQMLTVELWRGALIIHPSSKHKT
jgi:hypothetical protein